ncbi:Hypothetical protein D9617_23g004830 [Elsinoe fawcettii]|nr:Hypothetical protein D9617_23g004830 [Elsinoe fawcettii]
MSSLGTAAAAQMSSHISSAMSRPGVTTTTTWVHKHFLTISVFISARLDNHIFVVAIECWAEYENEQSKSLNADFDGPIEWAEEYLDKHSDSKPEYPTRQFEHATFN